MEISLLEMGFLHMVLGWGTPKSQVPGAGSSQGWAGGSWWIREGTNPTKREENPLRPPTKVVAARSASGWARSDNGEMFSLLDHSSGHGCFLEKRSRDLLG